MSRYRNKPRSVHHTKMKRGKWSDKIVINMFLELGLPFVLRFINDWRSGKTTVKEAVESVKNVKNGITSHPHSSEKESAAPSSNEEAEERFLEKVERELGLPEYNLFSMSLLFLPHTLYPVFELLLPSAMLDAHCSKDEKLTN
jgi:hypothetical protein